MSEAGNAESGAGGTSRGTGEGLHLPGSEAALVIISMLILVLPAFVPDGPQARIVPLALEVEPLVIEVDNAAWYEWALLDGIGEVRARRIVEYVRGHRPLAGIEQLREIRGLPGGWVEKAKPYLSLRREEAER